MAWWTTLLVVVQIICALSIIILVLLQHGKGADMLADVVAIIGTQDIVFGDVDR